jgi:flagellin-like protein
MNKNNLKSCIRKTTCKKNRAVAEVISSLLLVAITVVGAVLLTTFLDESFVSGGLAVSSATDSAIKGIKLTAYDTRDGSDLMDYVDLDNSVTTDQKLCRATCSGFPNSLPAAGGTEFMVIQFENRSVNSIFMEDVILNGVKYDWDPNTNGNTLDTTYPGDGKFSILHDDDGTTIQQPIEIQSGQKVNLVIKLDSDNPDIQLSKTIQAKINIGASSLSEFLIESGGAQ